METSFKTIGRFTTTSNLVRCSLGLLLATSLSAFAAEERPRDKEKPVERAGEERVRDGAEGREKPREKQRDGDAPREVRREGERREGVREGAQRDGVRREGERGAREGDARVARKPRPLNALLYKVQSPSALLIGVGDAGKEMVLPIEPDTEIYLQGNKIALTDLKPDMQLVIQQENGLTRRIEVRLPRRGGGRDGERIKGEGAREGVAREKEQPTEKKGEREGEQRSVEREK
jgi:hypothetical protein